MNNVEINLLNNTEVTLLNLLLVNLKSPSICKINIPWSPKAPNLSTIDQCFLRDFFHHLVRKTTRPVKNWWRTLFSSPSFNFLFIHFPFFDSPAPNPQAEICWVLQTHKWNFAKISLKSLSHPCEKSNFQTISYKHNPNICEIYNFPPRVEGKSVQEPEIMNFEWLQEAISIKKISPFHSHLSRAISITLLLITHSTNLPCLVCMFLTKVARTRKLFKLHKEMFTLTKQSSSVLSTNLHNGNCLLLFLVAKCTLWTTGVFWVLFKLWGCF